jgi:hypothetical protein
MTKTERIICLLSLGSWCIYKAYRASDETMLWDWLILLIIGILALLTFTWFARKDPAYRKRLRLPTLPGAVVTLTIAGLFFLQNNKRELPADASALGAREVKKDSLTPLDKAKADRALQAWLIRRSPLLHNDFMRTTGYKSRSRVFKP